MPEVARQVKVLWEAYIVRGKQYANTNRGGRIWRRRGAATVEMAVVSPILLAMLFGIVEYGWLFMLQSNVTNAARDACRVGILPYANDGAADTAIRARFALSIAGTGLAEGNGYTLAITRTTDANNVTTVRVTANVPWDRASLVGGGLLPDPRALLSVITGGNHTARTDALVASCSMMKEGT
jgi:Flp pilus assembly protein TadG